MPEADPDRAAVRQRVPRQLTFDSPEARERWIEGLRPAGQPAEQLCASRAAWRREPQEPSRRHVARHVQPSRARASRRSRRCATCRPPRSTTKTSFDVPSRAKRVVRSYPLTASCFTLQPPASSCTCRRQRSPVLTGTYALCTLPRTIARPGIRFREHDGASGVATGSGSGRPVGARHRSPRWLHRGAESRAAV